MMTNEEEATAPVFRAITVNGRRRGLRLEKQFWLVLEDISRKEGLKIRDIIMKVEKDEGDVKNLASLLRVYALDWLQSNYLKLTSETSRQRVQAQVNTCPSPTFALSGKSGLKFYNSAFLHYIRSNIAMSESDAVQARLQLKIDMNSADLIEQLRNDNTESVALGFVIGLNNRQIRGKLKAALAFSDGEPLIIGYIIN